MSASPPPSRAGQIFLAGLGLSLAFAGAVFVWLMARSFERAREMRAWPEVPCEILVSEIEQRQVDPNAAPEFSQSLAYGYDYQGKSYTGDHTTLRGNAWTSDPSVAQQRVDRYPVGTKSTCRVDPKKPEFSVLKPDSYGPIYSIWFPGLFLIGGLVMTVQAFREPKPRP